MKWSQIAAKETDAEMLLSLMILIEERLKAINADECDMRTARQWLGLAKQMVASPPSPENSARILLTMRGALSWMAEMALEGDDPLGLDAFDPYARYYSERTTAPVRSAPCSPLDAFRECGFDVTREGDGLVTVAKNGAIRGRVEEDTALEIELWESEGGGEGERSPNAMAVSTPVLRDTAQTAVGPTGSAGQEAGKGAQDAADEVRDVAQDLAPVLLEERREEDQLLGGALKDASDLLESAPKVLDEIPGPKLAGEAPSPPFNRPYWNPAPCKHCGSYSTTLPQDTAFRPAHVVQCKDCGRSFSLMIRGEYFAIVPGEQLGVLPPYSRAERAGLEIFPQAARRLPPVDSPTFWQWMSSDGHSDYVVIPDWLYGRRWLLQINLLRSGYWLLWGSTWTLRGARERAAGFGLRWASILTTPSSVSKYRIPASVVALARKAAATRRPRP